MLQLFQQLFQALDTENKSSTACFCSELQRQVGGNGVGQRPASSMPEIEVRISGGIFLLSLTYWSNCCSHWHGAALPLQG